MLTDLNISNYALVDNLEVSFSRGLTVITGETGAGKSITLDALGLCLGDRADPLAVRSGSTKAEVSATFHIKNIPAAQKWLADRDLNQGDECMLRRLVTQEGRSKAYINGSPSTLRDCTELGNILMDIHSQHAHQSLLRKNIQRNLVDNFGGHAELAKEIEKIASDWLRIRKERDALLGNHDEISSRIQLLAYQLDELDSLHLAHGELEKLEADAKLFENALELLEIGHQSLSQAEQAEDAAGKAFSLINTQICNVSALDNSRELIDSARIALNEAKIEISAHIETIEVNPSKKAEIQNRLEKIYATARKHRIMPNQIGELHSQIKGELADLKRGSDKIPKLEEKLSDLLSKYNELGVTLKEKRALASNELIKRTEEILSSLGMNNCKLEIALKDRKTEEPHPYGQEEIEFLVATNPGSSKQPLGKIASGGELSRISLAIQVSSANISAIPSIVFDEIDSGIGGAVAEAMGRLLQRLAEHSQIICVTHLPQIAALGNSHMHASKSESQISVQASIKRLNESAKIREIARMLAGNEITASAIAHAKEMLESDQD